MDYQVLLGDQPRSFLTEVDDKTERIIKDNLRKLANDPYPRPNAGQGDREKITYKGDDAYRLHISRSYTAIYDIIEPDRVEVHIIEPIDKAHKGYGNS
jgi:mRNA-degrading endonuclease RelE of RelBE toxin-antitoxin system